MLEFAYELRQPVNFRIRAIFVPESLVQILFLSTIRSDFTLTIFQTRKESSPNWRSLATLRKFSNRTRVFYQFNDVAGSQLVRFHQEIAGDSLPNLDAIRWPQRVSWRAVQFLNPDHHLSAVVTSDWGVAFLGWPTGFLQSLATGFEPSGIQKLSGTVLFVDKKQPQPPPNSFIAGLSIFLLPKFDEVPSPLIKGGIEIRIQANGIFWIRDRMNSSVSNRYYYPMISAKIAEHDCYAFEIHDMLSYVSVSVTASAACAGLQQEEQKIPKSGTGRTLELSVVYPKRPRKVLIQKAGEYYTDILVERLVHSSGTIITLKPLFNLLLMLFASFGWQLVL